MLATPTSSFFHYGTSASATGGGGKRKRLSACGFESSFAPSSPSSPSGFEAMGKRVRTAAPATSLLDARVGEENIPFSAAFRSSGAITNSPSRPPTVEEQQAWSSSSSIRLEHALAPPPSSSHMSLSSLAKAKQRQIELEVDDDDMMMMMPAAPSTSASATAGTAAAAAEVRKSNWVRVVTSYGHSFVRADEVEALMSEGEVHCISSDDGTSSHAASPSAGDAAESRLWDSIEGDVEMDG
ncbi:uncharacterized protein PFL1_01791 [Pseudozyma flocculosa PF-1]|uniref:Uncharacterized protein n=1 Tax=Pseudozyma flocculosa TaxID=84751 RepID=A0A5C3EYK0_9BASI|nr:uncharacterized protein PFL1_01791 [Pseudozyma flocculosa PF-1]EPQ30894.1 hypothetical protein PFL1_01791 [Pseudozyma flocculosa PF-1]SPO36726.1 uncharacterized protein PSFLO_02197 [Pseudozyma flocculosa]